MGYGNSPVKFPYSIPDSQVELKVKQTPGLEPNGKTTEMEQESKTKSNQTDPRIRLALTVQNFHELTVRLKKAGTVFIVEPHLRFSGKSNEQYSMSTSDARGAIIDFYALTKPRNLETH